MTSESDGSGAPPDLGSDDGRRGDAAVDWLRSDRARSRFTRWRGLDQYWPDCEHLCATAEYERATGDPDSEVVVARLDGTIVGTAIVEPKPMESELFDVRVSEISSPCADASSTESASAISTLLDTATDTAHVNGARLVVLRLDAAQPGALPAAQSAGFRVVETSVTWAGPSAAVRESNTRGRVPGVTVEEFDGGSTRLHPAMGDRGVDRLRDATSNWALSRFRQDPRLDSERVDAYYARWIDNVVAGHWGSRLSLAYIDGRVVGLLVENDDEVLRAATGQHLRRVGWTVTTEQGRGAGRAMLERALLSTAGRGVVHEWETQSHNSATISMVARLPGAYPVRSTHVLHRWLD